MKATATLCFAPSQVSGSCSVLAATRTAAEPHRAPTGAGLPLDHGKTAKRLTGYILEWTGHRYSPQQPADSTAARHWPRSRDMMAKPPAPETKKGGRHLWTWITHWISAAHSMTRRPSVSVATTCGYSSALSGIALTTQPLGAAPHESKMPWNDRPGEQRGGRHQPAHRRRKRSTAVFG
jgi:hypothetical protein